MTTPHAYCDVAAFGRLCSSRPGVITDTGAHIYLCPPERPCTDVVVHRTLAHDWLTSEGTTPAQWFARHAQLVDAGTTTAQALVLLALVVLVVALAVSVVLSPAPALDGRGLLAVAAATLAVALYGAGGRRRAVR